MQKYEVWLSRITEAVEKRRETLAQTVLESGQDDFEGALDSAIRDEFWQAENPVTLELSHSEIVELLNALQTHQSLGREFGPVELFTIKNLASLTKCAAPVKTVVACSVRFNFPSITFEGNLNAFKKGLRFTPLFGSELRARTNISNITASNCSIVASTATQEGSLARCSVTGSLRFTVEISELVEREQLTSVLVQLDVKATNSVQPLPPLFAALEQLKVESYLVR